MKKKISREIIKENIDLIGLKGCLFRGLSYIASGFSEDELLYKETRKLIKPMNEQHLSIPYKGKLEGQKNNIIWVCWFQGIENAPEIVKLCYKNLIKKNPSTKIILLSDKNIHNYIDFPENIWYKYKRGIIKRSHFSDILRTALLYYRGGIWIDSTMLITEAIPNFIWDEDLFVFKYHNQNTNQVSSSQFIRAKSGNKILEKTLIGLYTYWSRYNKLYTYYLWHYVFARAVNLNIDLRKQFDCIPIRYAEDNHILQSRFFDHYNELDWEWIKSITFVHKLSYKHLKSDEDENTFYKHILKDYK